jgi:hypothetical protein
MSEFLLILHEDPQQYAGMSAAQMQAVVERYRRWAEGLGAAGHLRGGQKLRDEGGLHLRRRGSERLATSGPYAEAKDVIGGFFTIEARDYAHAQALCADCPHLQHGWIELREIEPT